MSLEQFRKQAGLSQADLAEQSGVSQAQISHLEKLRRKPERMALEDCRAVVAAINGAGIACNLDDVFPAAEETQTPDSNAA